MRMCDDLEPHQPSSLIMNNVADQICNHAHFAGKKEQWIGGGQEGAARPPTPWTAGKVYSVLPGRLSFAAFHSHADARKCEQDVFPDKVFVSGDFQDLYQPFATDFGPVNLGVVHSFCEFLKTFSNCSEEIVYYSVCMSSPFFARSKCHLLLLKSPKPLQV